MAACRFAQADSQDFVVLVYIVYCLAGVGSSVVQYPHHLLVVIACMIVFNTNTVLCSASSLQY